MCEERSCGSCVHSEVELTKEPCLSCSSCVLDEERGGSHVRLELLHKWEHRKGNKDKAGVTLRNQRRKMNRRARA